MAFPASICGLIGRAIFPGTTGSFAFIGRGVLLYWGVLIVFAVRFGFLKVPVVLQDSERMEKVEIRWNWLVVAGIGMVISFVLFGGNRFNTLNLFTWIFAIVSLFDRIISSKHFSENFFCGLRLLENGCALPRLIFQ